jgi:acetyl esterase/lipase
MNHRSITSRPARTPIAGAALLFLATALPAFAAPERLPLWNGTAPVAAGITDTNQVFITVYHPTTTTNGASVVICPGGGYGGLVTGGEGSGIARWLNQRGTTGIVLEYRLPRGRPFVPLLDAQRAIRTVRSRAPDWGCDPARVGIIGFSAGGHLASTAATHFDGGNATATDPVERLSCRPDFAILIYPVISMGPETHGGSKANLLGKSPTPELVKLFSNELQVTDRTPPCYLAHAQDDTVVTPANSALFHAALRQNGVATEYLELPSGGHGLNGYQGPMWDAWRIGSLKWLTSLKMIPARKSP